MPPVIVSGERGDRRDDDRRHSAEYRTYLDSVAWEKRRARMIAVAGHRCQSCGATTGLEVHHLTYNRLGEERDSDLEVLCPPCHVRADRERAASTRRRVEHRRFEGWAAKVYGDDWGQYEDESEVRERYERWLERKGLA